MNKFYVRIKIKGIYMQKLFYRYRFGEKIGEITKLYIPKSKTDIFSILNEIKNKKIYKMLVRGTGISPFRYNINNRNIVHVITTDLTSLRLNNNDVVFECGIRWIDLFNKLTEDKIIPTIFPLYSPYSSLGGILASNLAIFNYGKYGQYNYIDYLTLITSDNEERITGIALNNIIGFMGSFGIIYNIYMHADKKNGKTLIYGNSKEIFYILNSYNNLLNNALYPAYYYIYKYGNRSYGFQALFEVKDQNMIQHIVKLIRKNNVAVNYTYSIRDFIKIHSSIINIFIKMGYPNYNMFFIEVAEKNEYETLIKQIDPLSPCYIYEINNKKGLFLLTKYIDMSKRWISYAYIYYNGKSYFVGNKVRTLNKLKNNYDSNNYFMNILVKR